MGKSKIDRTCQIGINNFGSKMVIKEYRMNRDMDVCFPEYDWTVKGVQYDNFKKGNIKNPNVKNKYMAEKLNKRNSRIGETNIACNGLKMTIIEYHDAKNIDIQFEDGLIIKHKTYNSFRKGEIKHPDITVHDRLQQKYKNEYLGTESIMSNGMTAKCIAYRTYKDIDIQFEDGIIIKHIPMSRFIRGKILHPTKNNYTKRTEKCRQEHINEISLSSDNLNAQIIKYNNAHNITVRFENGIIKQNVGYYNFKNGRFAMPTEINNITIKSFAYRLNNEWYYICSHPDWTEDRILSVKEIYQNKCHSTTKKQIIRKRFTENELKLIMDFSISNEQLAKQLNRSINSVITKRNRMKHEI